MPLGRNIKNLRVARGLSREEVVGSEYSTSHLAAVEQGVKRPSIEMLDYVVDQLRVPLVKLLEEILQSAQLPTPEMLRLARKLSRDGEHREAVRILSETVSRDDVTTGQYRADCLSTQALVEYGRGNYERALEVYEQLRDLRERGGNRFLTARAYYYLGTVESQMGRYLRARHWLFMGWQRLRAIQSDYPEFGCQFLLAYANAVTCTGGWSEACNLYTRVADDAEAVDEPRVELLARWGIGLCRMMMQDYSEAEEQLRRCLEFEEHIDNGHRAELLTLLGAVLTEQGNADEAVGVLNEGLSLRDGQRPLGQVRSICQLIEAHLEYEEVSWDAVDPFVGRLKGDMLEGLPKAETAFCSSVMAEVKARLGEMAEAEELTVRALKSASYADSYVRCRVIGRALDGGLVAESERLRNLLARDMCSAVGGTEVCVQETKMPHSVAVEQLVGNLHSVRK